uniref:Uncharacterized protein n=1 Tax=Strongyloides venezuelensis TaxID=75913 RepID=A0A0K0FEK8_STRVS
MPLTHKSSPYLKRYRLPSLKFQSSNATKSVNYDDFSSPEEGQSEKALSQILKAKKEAHKFKSQPKNNDTSNMQKEYNVMPFLLEHEKEEKTTTNLENKCINNNNQEEVSKTEVENDMDNNKIKEMQKVICNEIENLEKRFKELELLMKF